MVYAFPRFDDGRAILRFRNSAKIPVTLRHIILRVEPFVGGAVPDILRSPFEIPVGNDIDLDVTAELVEHVATDNDAERTVQVHFDLSYEPKDEQPDGRYLVRSQGRTIVGFGSD